MNDVYYFGCWGQPGHFLHAPGGSSYERHGQQIVHYSGGVHVDGTLAPRRARGSDKLVWTGKNDGHRMHSEYRSEECPQGQFLRHELDNGFTAISWWDRTQGDSRGACNSTILMRGVHSSEAMLEALRTHFPEVLANLTKAGVQLQEVFT